MSKSPLRYVLIAAYMFLMAFPGWVFFSARPGLPMTAQTLFPLFGLYAFTFVAMQVIIGSNMRRLRPVMGAKLLHFHRWQGIFALSFAFIHPLMIISVLGPKEVIFDRGFLPEQLRPFVTPGIIAGDLMLLTVVTAVLAWKFQKLTRAWRVIHFANYGVFVLAWIHSWFIGSDISSTPLRWVWLFYLAAWCVSLLLRIWGSGASAKAEA